jgi:hypothetical protein
MPICINCNKKFPFSVKIDGKKRNLCSRHCCLECVPFKDRTKSEILNKKRRNNKRNNNKKTEITITKNCSICNKNTKCAKSICDSCRTRLRRYLTRKACIDFLGNKCKDCGWTGDFVCFDIHHYTGDKEFTICGSEYKSWASIKIELKKCILLCAICHRKRHLHTNEDMIKYINERYSGTVFDNKD